MTSTRSALNPSRHPSKHGLLHQSPSLRSQWHGALLGVRYLNVTRSARNPLLRWRLAASLLLSLQSCDATPDVSTLSTTSNDQQFPLLLWKHVKNNLPLSNVKSNLQLSNVKNNNLPLLSAASPVRSTLNIMENDKMERATLRSPPTRLLPRTLSSLPHQLL